MEEKDYLDQLFNKLELLLKRQEDFSKEINELREEIYTLKIAEPKKLSEKKGLIDDKLVQQHITETRKLYRHPKNGIISGVCAGLADYFGIYKIVIRLLFLTFSLFFGIGFLIYAILWIITPSIEKQSQPVVFSPSPQPKRKTTLPKISTNLEKFIGENLISKIGIIITIIGVSIGAKYTIEHDLISPLTRIILGYLIGLGLLGFGIKLKKNYINFSAVLVSGAIAIVYFMTFSAYSFYNLIPQALAFAMMAIFTVLAVFAALNYDKQVIAHIGLVGAYAVPFLLSDGTEQVVILFSYTAIINIGILIIAFKKYWKPLYYASFVLSWLIYFTWYTSEYQTDKHFELALYFLSIFFIIFYVTFLAYKLIRKVTFEIEDIFLLLSNSFIFYGIGYSILSKHPTAQQYLGLFTICNAFIHLTISAIIYKQKLGDKNLFYLISGLVLVFITIAIPVQLNGNWVTLLWAGEAVLLFWIGRTKNAAVYEKISYPLMILALFSIFQDWEAAYVIHSYETTETLIAPIFNIHFITSILFIVAFIFINFVNLNKKYKSALTNQHGLLKLAAFTIPATLLIIIYLSFLMEINVYWDQLYWGSEQTKFPYFNYDFRSFKTIWTLIYSMLFLILLSFLNFNKIKNRKLGLINLALNALLIIIFLGGGLYALSELRDSYLDQNLAELYSISTFKISVRYISFVFVAGLLFSSYLYIKKEFMKVAYTIIFDLFLYSTIIWILSSEIIHWMDILGSSQSYKLGLSILWGVYSLLIVAFGIWKKKKYLRIGAIALFSITLIKLFFYDVTHLATVPKTILFISLGILLLIISFLYNKFTHKISEE